MSCLHLVLSGEHGQEHRADPNPLRGNARREARLHLGDLRGSESRYNGVMPACSRSERVSEYRSDSTLFTNLLTNEENMREGHGERLQRDQTRRH